MKYNNQYHKFPSAQELFCVINYDYLIALNPSNLKKYILIKTLFIKLLNTNTIIYFHYNTQTEIVSKPS